RFVGPDGNAVHGVTVHGLVAPPRAMAVVFDGSEAEVLALEPGKPRPVIAFSNDGKYAAKTMVGADDLQPLTVPLEPTGSVSGRLLKASTGLPLAGYSALIAYSGADNVRPFLANEPLKTGTDGRFLIRGLMPGLGASISFQEPLPANSWMYTCEVYKPDSLRNLVLRAGEVRDVGEIRVKPSANAKSGTNR
ncbi:MAG: hypothetical protein ACREHD_08900, partial [Pirellulales bacterium]